MQVMLPLLGLILLRLASAIDGVAQDPIAWRSCLHDDGTDSLHVAECATARLPLRYDGRADSLGVAVMRILGNQAAAQLWFLDGGPGDAGTASLGRLARALDMADVDLYTLDHRGVGGTARLECPHEEGSESTGGNEIVREEWSACVAFLREFRNDLDALTASNAAIDLSRLIDLLREPGKRVVVMGVSYGTYLAQTYLRMYPDQPDAVILDGVVPPDWTFAEFDAGLDVTARRVLDRCSLDQDCHRRLGPDPVETAFATMDMLNEGHCSGIGLTPQLTRVVLGSMLMIDAVPPAAMMALIHRIRRCAWHDRIAILHMFREVFSDLSEPPSHAPVLQRHVAMSEMWPLGTIDTLAFEHALDRYVMTTGVSASFSRTFSIWPVYQRPIQHGHLARYTGPLLLLHGGLDPTMPFERVQLLRGFYTADEQTFVLFPDAGHVVLNESPCAASLYKSFIRIPNRRPDTSCVASAPRLSLRTDADASQAVFGTDDMWGDNVTLVENVVFAILFRCLAIVVGLGFVGVGVHRWMRSDRNSRLSWKASVGVLVGWVGISAMMWFSLFTAPLLMDYGIAKAAALSVVVLQVLVGVSMTRRVSRRAASI